MKYSVITFGCRVNQSDSLGFEESLLASGAEASAADTADVVIVNTCSVTASADQGARQTIRRIARVNPNARIVVTGCYATRDRGDVEQLPGVAQVVCNDDKPRLMTFIRSSTSSSLDDESPIGSLPTTAERFGEGEGGCGATIEPGVAGRTAYTLRVQTGCAESCSYCIIPQTRGIPRSVSLPVVLAEVRRVMDAGFQEVALTGVHLGSYGRDLEPRTTLVELLRALAELARMELDVRARRVLFRISSLEPMDCSDAVVNLVRDSACFAPHFHLPLQHASARLLQAMRRPYDLAYYATLVDRDCIRRDIPHASIGTDIIVGFPGETDADARELADYLERSPLTHPARVPLLGSARHRGVATGDRPSGLLVKQRSRRAPRDRQHAVEQVHLGAARNRSSGADTGRWNAGGDGELREGADRRRADAQSLGDARCCSDSIMCFPINLSNTS
ncbi:MAG: MiaB/RimO family radical SAM methylthiotransferase, partial [Vicinamibacterales bacterium]